MTKHYAHKPSRLLTAQQNKGLFNALRPSCTSLVTTVAILYYYINRQWVKQRFGILCIERDTGIKKYFLRFYSLQDMGLLIQQKIKKYGGKPFIVVWDLFFQMVINGRSIAFEFIDNPAGWEESSYVAKALRGSMKKLKREAEGRFYEEHPEKQKESRFKRLLHRKNRESKKKLLAKDISGPTDPRHMQHGRVAAEAKASLDDWILDPVIKVIFYNMGIEVDEAMENKDYRQEVEQTITKYGGLETFKQTVVSNGFASGLDASLGQVATSIPIRQNGSLPKTPPKVALDTIAVFTPASRVQLPRDTDICKSLEKVFQEEEEFVAPALPAPPAPPVPSAKGATPTTTMTTSPKQTTPGKAASTSPAEKPAESQGAEEDPSKPLVPGSLAYDLNLMCQKFAASRMKREEEEQKKREEEAAKKAQGKAAPKATEKTPEREAPKIPGKTPEREAPRTPEKTPEKDAPRTPEKTPEREAPRTPEKTPERDAPKTPENTPEKEAPRTPEKTPEKDAPRTPEKTPEKDAPRTPEKTPEKEAPRTPEKTPEREAPRTPEKTPEKDAPRTPEKTPEGEAPMKPEKTLKESSSVSGTSDETTGSDSDSDQDWD